MFEGPKVKRLRAPGGGRKPKGPRSSEKHKARLPIDPAHPQHVVIRVTPQVAPLRDRDGWEAVCQGLALTARRHDMRICHVSLQPDHVHLIAEADHVMALARGVQGFVIAFSRRLNKLRRTRGKVITDRYHSIPLTTPAEVRYALAYVLTNWWHHGAQRGLRLDPYSSAALFDGWTRRPSDVRDAGLPRPPVTMAMTWLLQIGWKREGLIAPTEHPPTPTPRFE
jgi:REP element-mobilizing transposase RayT